MRGRRSYKFTDKHHSKGGIRSSVAGLISLICTFGGIFGAFLAKGNAGKYVALLGVIAIIGCVYGLFVGNRSLKEEDCILLFSRLGTVVNFLLLIFWIAVAGMGFLL